MKCHVAVVQIKEQQHSLLPPNLLPTLIISFDDLVHMLAFMTLFQNSILQVNDEE